MNLEVISRKFYPYLYRKHGHPHETKAYALSQDIQPEAWPNGDDPSTALRRHLWKHPANRPDR